MPCHAFPLLKHRRYAALHCARTEEGESLHGGRRKVQQVVRELQGRQVRARSSFGCAPATPPGLQRRCCGDDVNKEPSRLGNQPSTHRIVWSGFLSYNSALHLQPRLTAVPPLPGLLDYRLRLLLATTTTPTHPDYLQSGILNFLPSPPLPSNPLLQEDYLPTRLHTLTSITLLYSRSSKRLLAYLQTTTCCH